MVTTKERETRMRIKGRFSYAAVEDEDGHGASVVDGDGDLVFRCDYSWHRQTPQEVARALAEILNEEEDKLNL